MSCATRELVATEELHYYLGNLSEPGKAVFVSSGWFAKHHRSALTPISRAPGRASLVQFRSQVGGDESQRLLSEKAVADLR